MNELVAPFLRRVREQVLRVQRPVRVSGEVDGLIAVVAVRVLDQPPRPPEKVTDVWRQTGVVTGDTDIEIALISSRLEPRIHSFIRRRTGGLAVVDDLHVDATLVRETLAERLVGVSVEA